MLHRSLFTRRAVAGAALGTALLLGALGTPSAQAGTRSAGSASTHTGLTAAKAAAAASDYTTRADWAQSVLKELNAERAANGRAALTLNTRLSNAAASHNLKMAQANTLSHQLSGEASLGKRITAAGYSWRACGENIAWNSQRSEAGVLAVQKSMYNETPPNDGHRRNILSTSFTQVGISVIDDAVHRKVWLVTDFGQPA